MMDLFWYYASTLAFLCVFGAILCVYRYSLGNKLTEQSNKLKSQIANIRRDYPHLSENPQELVENSLEGIGIEGIIDSLGLPKVVTPFIKGFLSNPENISKILEILKSKGINFDVNKPKSEEIGLL